MAFRSCPDDERLSKQDRTRAHPCFAATHVSAHTLNNSCYRLLGFAFGQRFFASQCSSTQGGSFGVLELFLDVFGSAFQLLRYFSEYVVIVFMGSLARGFQNTYSSIYFSL